MKLFAVGLSHKTAPVEVREQFAVKQSAVVDLAFVLKCFGLLEEIVLLSTCNRVEMYGTTGRSISGIRSLFQLPGSTTQQIVNAAPGHVQPRVDPGSARVSRAGDSLSQSRTSRIGSNRAEPSSVRKDCFGETPKPTRETRALPGKNRTGSHDIDSYLYVHEGDTAVRHLLRVTAGLDSMALGETEITGQIKNAYEIARNAGMTGRVLNRLFQKAFQVAKEIRTSTGIGRGTISIKSMAVELIENGDPSQQSIMVLGAGAMAESCTRMLVKKGARSILISNRSFDHAINLATRCGGQAVCFGCSLFEMCKVDAVIVATSNVETLRDDIEHLIASRHQRPLLLIDLSVPRNIDLAGGELENVSLYNIDDLEAVARLDVRPRERELPACHQIVEAHVAVLIEKFHTEDERRSVAYRTDRLLPNDAPTASNILLPAA